MFKKMNQRVVMFSVDLYCRLVQHDMESWYPHWRSPPQWWHRKDFPLNYTPRVDGPLQLLSPWLFVVVGPCQWCHMDLIQSRVPSQDWQNASSKPAVNKPINNPIQPVPLPSRGVLLPAQIESRQHPHQVFEDCHDDQSKYWKKWHASGSCPMKFDWVTVNILYVFSRSYWSFSLWNLNFRHTPPPFLSVGIFGIFWSRIVS
jgi:hypothetical protein